MSDEKAMETRPHEQVLLIAVLKRVLDDESTQKLVDGVLVAAAARPSVPVVLDFAQVRFAPSVALGALVQLSSSFKLDARRVAVVGLSERVRETVRVTQLHKVVEIHATLEDFLAAGAGSKPGGR